MADEKKYLNVYQANSIDSDDNDFSKNKIIEGVNYGLKEYLEYIKICKTTIQDQKAVRISVNPKIEGKSEKVKYYLNLENLSDKESEKIEVEIFTKELKVVYKDKPNGDPKVNNSLSIQILNRNQEKKYIELDTDDELRYIWLKADDYQLRKQKEAVQRLLNQPLPEHTPLLKLFDLCRKASGYYAGNIVSMKNDPEWKILTDPDRDGTTEQRAFVKKAMETNDFALLEGPPGSGKTTAIIELIIQLVQQNKRVLLVSATHVAVDNVIDRILTEYKKQCDGIVVPLRIGEKDNIRKESVLQYRLQNLVKKTKSDVRNNLANRRDQKSSERLYQCLSDPKESEQFDNIILKSVNLIGGTMVGILQHPDIKSGNQDDLFDVMIVDESSKVTFLDFLVPALYAKKWILIGDKNQLSPYVDDDFIESAVDQLPLDEQRKKYLAEKFEINKILSSNRPNIKDSVKIVFSDILNPAEYKDFGKTIVVDENLKASSENIKALNSCNLIFCNRDKKTKQLIGEHVSAKAIVIGAKIESQKFQKKQKSLHKNPKNISEGVPFEFEINVQTWSEMVASRLTQWYQYRFDAKFANKIKEELDRLVPGDLQPEIDKIKRLALPSIIELLQIGIGKTYSKNGTPQNKLIYEGFMQFEEIVNQKFQTLTFQHRMHDDIATIPRKYFYEERNLKTSNKVKERTDILAGYKKDESKVIWVDNNDRTFDKKVNGKKKNINPREVDYIKSELNDFIQFARSNSKNEDYHIAVLTFYRQQEYQLKQMLRKMTGQFNENKNFKVHNVQITLCTVDKFQGDEADMVLLSFTKNTKSAFYNSLNRLNVALTRARYKLVLFGNRKWFAHNAESDALKSLAIDYKERLSYNSVKPQNN